MPKNITLSIPDDLSAQMDALAEVNWSAVARQSIEDYVNRRKDPEMGPLIEKLKKEKDSEYRDGIAKIVESFQNKSYDTVEIIVEKFNERSKIVKRQLREDNARRTVTINASRRKAEQEFEKVKYELMFSVLVEVRVVGTDQHTNSFMKGMYDAVFKVWENVKESGDD